MIRSLVRFVFPPSILSTDTCFIYSRRNVCNVCIRKSFSSFLVPRRIFRIDAIPPPRKNKEKERKEFGFLANVRHGVEIGRSRRFKNFSRLLVRPEKNLTRSNLKFTRSFLYRSADVSASASTFPIPITSPPRPGIFYFLRASLYKFDVPAAPASATES